MVNVTEAPDLKTQSGRLRAARLRNYGSMRGAANAFGWNENTYKSHEQGIRRGGALTEDDARKYARAFGVSVQWLLTGRGSLDEGGEPAERRTIPLVGYVGAGDAAHFYATGDDPNETVDAPDWATAETRAAEIRGASLGPLLEGWLVYFDKERPGVPSEFFGKLCVVGLPDDRVLVKRVRPSRGPGFFHLESNNEPIMLDEEVVWSALVKEMRPR